MKTAAIVLCVNLLAVPTFAFTISPPTKSPACPTGEQARLLQDGIDLFDGGSYGEHQGMAGRQRG